MTEHCLTLYARILSFFLKIYSVLRVFDGFFIFRFLLTCGSDATNELHSMSGKLNNKICLPFNMHLLYEDGIQIFFPSNIFELH